MKALFVYSLPDAPPPPARPLHSWTQINMGISYIASVLKVAGNDVKLLIPRRGRYKKDIDNCLSEYDPQIICYTAVATEYPFIKRVADYICLKKPMAYEVIGGPHVTLNPDKAINGPFDAVCVGEGEFPALELAKFIESGKKPSRIPNLWIQQGDEIEKNEPRELIPDLDKLPFPYREMWAPWVEPNSEHSILLGRGCPHNCTYCCNHALRKIAKGNYVRMRSIPNIISELDELVEKFPGVTSVYLEVETITAKTVWAIELCDALEKFNISRSSKIEFGTNVRLAKGRSLRDLFEAFRRAGIKYINVGIESGSETVRRQVLNRVYTNEDVIRVFREAREFGLSVTAYNLVGLPGETEEDFRETIELNREVLPDRNYLSIFFPYPGTELHNLCLQRGINIKLEEESGERFRAVLGLPEFPDRNVNHYFRWFDWYVYRKNRSKLKIVSYAAMRTLGAYPKLFRGYRMITSRDPLAGLKRRLR